MFETIALLFQDEDIQVKIKLLDHFSIFVTRSIDSTHRKIAISIISDSFIPELRVGPTLAVHLKLRSI